MNTTPHPSVVADAKFNGINIYIPLGEYANLMLPLTLKSARSLVQVLQGEIAKCEDASTAADSTSTAPAVERGRGGAHA